MKRSLALAVFFLVPFFAPGVFPAAQAAPASGAAAPGKAACCAGKEAAGKDASCGDKGECCGGKSMNPEMGARMEEMDKRLDGFVATMNSAKGEEKVDAMAAVINEMLARRKAMHAMRHDHHCARSGGAAATDVGKMEEKSEGLLGEQEHSH